MTYIKNIDFNHIFNIFDKDTGNIIDVADIYSVACYKMQQAQKNGVNADFICTLNMRNKY